MTIHAISLTALAMPSGSAPTAATAIPSRKGGLALMG